MDDAVRLQAENVELQQQVEAYRQRELADLRGQLAAATANAAHYRAEAQRNADLGRKIYAEAQTESARLRERISALERIPNARIGRPG